MPFILRQRLSANNPEYINFPGLKQIEIMYPLNKSMRFVYVDCQKIWRMRCGNSIAVLPR